MVGVRVCVHIESSSELLTIQPNKKETLIHIFYTVTNCQKKLFYTSLRDCMMELEKSCSISIDFRLKLASPAAVL